MKPTAQRSTRVVMTKIALSHGHLWDLSRDNVTGLSLCAADAACTGEVLLSLFSEE